MSRTENIALAGINSGGLRGRYTLMAVSGMILMTFNPFPVKRVSHKARDDQDNVGLNDRGTALEVVG